MNPIFTAALDLQRWCDGRRWPFCIIGGVAVQRWGEPRFTRDVDCTILVGFGNEASHVDALLEGFAPRIQDARAFALANRVLLLVHESGTPLDVSLGALPYEARIIERASPFSVSDDATITTCSAEDLVVLKAFAGRDRDWADIDGVVSRQGTRLNRDLVLAELALLLELKEDSDEDATGRLLRMFAGRTGPS